MKKIFYFVAALAVLAVGFTGCKKDKEKEPEPEVTNPKLVITVDSITATSAFIAVVPEVDTLTYYWTYYEKADLEGLTDEEIIEQGLIGEMDYIIEYYAEVYSKTITYEELLSVGEDSYGLSFSPNTEYVALAAYIDAEGNITFGDLFKKEFKTPDVEIISEETLEGLTGTYIDDYRDYDESYILYLGDAAESIEIALNLFDVDFAGEFTEEDMDLEYCYFWTSDLGDEAESIVKASITATLNEDGISSVFAGWIVTASGAKYNFEANVPFESLLTPAEGDDDVEPLPARKVQAKKTASIKNLKGAEKVKGFKALKK